MALTAGFVIIIAVLFGTVHSSTCKAFQISKNNLNKALIGHSVLVINDTNHQDCARTCMSMSVCKSTDFDRQENRCKLNDADRSSVHPSEFKTKGGSIFSDISEWPSTMVKSCSSRPCKVNQRCYQKGDSHVCKDITCDINLTIDNGKIQVNKPGENKFLDIAAVKCDTGYFPSQKEVKCEASGKWQPVTCELPRDCKDVLDKIPKAKSGQYQMELWKSGKVLTVHCDMETDGGGWTIIHRRMDGSVDFYRNFSEYENGFGNIEGEFWLGLKYIQELAEQGSTELRLDMTDAGNKSEHETYQDFKLTEGTNYTLNIGSCTTSGITGNGLAGGDQMPFSTFDRDLDKVDYNLAILQHGAWWFGKTYAINLNGLYVTPGTDCRYPGLTALLCGHSHLQVDGWHSLRASSMTIRRI